MHELAPAVRAGKWLRKKTSFLGLKKPKNSQKVQILGFWGYIFGEIL